MADVTYRVIPQRHGTYAVEAMDLDGWRRTTGEFHTLAEAEAAKDRLEKIVRGSQEQERKIWRPTD